MIDLSFSLRLSAVSESALSSRPQLQGHRLCVRFYLSISEAWSFGTAVYNPGKGLHLLFPHCSKWNGSCYFQSPMSPWVFICTLASSVINLYSLKNILTCLPRHICYGVPGVELWQTITTLHSHCLILKCQKHTCAGLLNSGHYFLSTAVLSQSTSYLCGASGDRWSPAGQVRTCTHLSFHFGPPMPLLLF